MKTKSSNDPESQIQDDAGWFGIAMAFVLVSIAAVWAIFAGDWRRKQSVKTPNYNSLLDTTKDV